MVKMGNVWDRTVEVLGGRGGMLAGIAIPTLYLPGLVSAAHAAYATPATAAYALVGGLVSLAVAALAIWGQLALTAAASDPAVDRRAAWRAAVARIGAGLGVAVLLGLLLGVAILPLVVILVRAGVDMTGMSSGQAPTMTPATAAIVALYAVILGIALLFVGARLVPLYAVVVNERRGLGAIARTWRLTRRHSWRLAGVLLLFVIVLGVATAAAQSVAGVIARLILGVDATATAGFVAAVVGSAVATVFSVVAIVFSAQLYVALVARERPLA